MNDMYEAAGEALPVVNGGLAYSLGEGHRDESDELNSRKLTVTIDPEWTSAPSQVRALATAIRTRAPRYLEDLNIADVEDYDLVLNEALARSTSSTSYLGVLREIQEVCGDRAGLICEVLEVPMRWSELKRSIVREAIRREGEFTLFELIQEVKEAQ